MIKTTIPNDEMVREQSEETRKPYESPKIVYRAPLEATAGICPPPPAGSGKAVVGVGGCIVGQS